METYGIEKYGIISPKAVYRNLNPAQLTEAALRRGEGSLCENGALVVTTGKYTGRSPEDKFIVDTPAVHDEIAWGKVNKPITEKSLNPSATSSALICRTAKSSCSTALRVRTRNTHRSSA